MSTNKKINLLNDFKGSLIHFLLDSFLLPKRELNDYSLKEWLKSVLGTHIL